MARFFNTKSLRKKVSAPKRVSAQQAFTGLRKDPEALRKAAAASAMRTLQNKLIEAKRAQVAAQKLDTLAKVASGKKIPQTQKQEPLNLNTILRKGVNRGTDVAKDAGKKFVQSKWFQSQAPGINFALENIDKPTNFAAGALNRIAQQGGKGSSIDLVKGGIEGVKNKTYASDLLGTLGLKDGKTKNVAGFVGDVVLDPTNYIPGKALLGAAVAGSLKATGKAGAKKVAKEAGEELLEQATKKTAKKAGSLIDDAVKPQTVDNYLKEVVDQQKTARGLENPGVKQKAKDFYREAKSAMVDFASPIEDVLRNAEKKGGFEILPEKHITNQIDRVLRAPSMAGQFLRDNGLDRVIKQVDSLDELDQYLIAKHAKDVSKKLKDPRRFAIGESQIGKKANELSSRLQSLMNERKFKFQDTYKKIGQAPKSKQSTLRKKAIRDYRQATTKIDSLKNELAKLDKQAKNLASQKSKNVIETGRDLAKDEKLVKLLGPKYEQHAKTVVDYSRKMLDYSVDSGLIGRELADRLKKEYPNYVPLKRIMDEVDKVDLGVGRAIASQGKQSIVQKLKGSKREIESPIQSLVEKTADAFQQGEKNKAARMLADYKDLPGNPFGIRELKDGEKAAHTISYLDEGVLKKIEVPKEIEDAAKYLNAQQLNIVGKIFSLPVRVAKAGITGFNIPFIAKNYTRDNMTAIINSDNALKTSFANPKVFLKGLFEAVNHGEVYEEMARQGALGTSFDIARSQAVPTIKKIRAGKSAKSKAKYLATNPMELLRAIEDVVGRSEEPTRITQYLGTKQAMLEKGMLPERAEILASRAARENTINFARHGEFGRALNGVFLYLNASIQGTRTFVRTAKKAPGKTATKVALMGFVPVAGLTAWNLSDPKRKEAYEDILDYEKENNFIIVPPNPQKDEKGRWNIIKVPMSQEIGNLVTIARRGVEFAHGLDPLSVGEIAKNLIGTVSPIEPSTKSLLSTLVPQAVRPTAEAFSNYDFFRQKAIVPEYLEKLPKDLQAYDYTSGTARKIARPFNASPIGTERFIKSTFGGVGAQALNASDRILAAAGLIPKEQVGGQDVGEATGAAFTKAWGGKKSEQELLPVQEATSEQEKEKFLTKQKAKQIYNELKDIPPEEAKSRLKEVKKEDENLFEKVRQEWVSEKSDLTKVEKSMFGLGVMNGARAEFIFKQAEGLGSAEEKKAYLKRLEDAGLITENVKKQLKVLYKGEGS